MRGSVKSRSAVAVFLALCALPLPLWILCGGTASTRLENRELTTAPVLNPDNVGAFPAEFEGYFNDRIPFRSALVWANSALDYVVFGASSNRDVIIGEEGWLLYRPGVEQYTGRTLFNEQELVQIAQNMQAVQELCDSRGIDFVLFLAPNKERTYGDCIPASYGHQVEQGQYEQVIEYLETYTDVRVVHPDGVLDAWRATHSEPVGYLADTHWNSLGGYLGAAELLAALDREAPSLQDILVKDPPVHDLADMLHLEQTVDTGKDYVPVFKESATKQDTDFFGHITYQNPQGKGSILVRRDSFCTAMNRTLAQPWQSYDAVHYSSFEWKMIDEQQPDVFVIELVERDLNNLLGLSLL